MSLKMLWVCPRKPLVPAAGVHEHLLRLHLLDPFSLLRMVLGDFSVVLDFTVWNIDHLGETSRAFVESTSKEQTRNTDLDNLGHLDV